MIHLAIIVPNRNMVLKSTGWVSADKDDPRVVHWGGPCSHLYKSQGIRNLIQVYITSTYHIFYALEYWHSWWTTTLSGDEVHHQPVQLQDSWYVWDSTKNDKTSDPNNLLIMWQNKQKAMILCCKLQLAFANFVKKSFLENIFSSWWNNACKRNRGWLNFL